MRKFLVGGGAGSSQNQSQSEDSGEGNPNSVTPVPRPAEQELLGLAHLKKLFADYQSPSHPLTESEKEAKLYAMLPLFCKVSHKPNMSVVLHEYEVNIHSMHIYANGYVHIFYVFSKYV